MNPPSELELPFEPSGLVWHHTLPVAPGSNHRLIPGRHGKLFLNPENRQYKDDVAWLLKLSKERPVGVPVGLGILWYMANQRRDLDSILKSTFDALEGSALENDRQIRELYVRAEVVPGERARQETYLWKLK